MDYFEKQYRNKTNNEIIQTCCNHMRNVILANQDCVCQNCGYFRNDINEDIDWSVNYEFYKSNEFFKSYIETRNYKLKKMHIWLSHNHTEITYKERKNELEKIVNKVYKHNNLFINCLANEYHSYYTDTKSKAELVVEVKKHNKDIDTNKMSYNEICKYVRKHKLSIVNKNRNRSAGILLSMFYFIIKTNYNFNNTFDKIIELIEYMNINISKYNNFIKKYIMTNDLFNQEENIIILPLNLLKIVKYIKELEIDFDITNFILTFNKYKKQQDIKIQEKVIMAIILIKDNSYKDKILKFLKVSNNIYNKYIDKVAVL